MIQDCETQLCHATMLLQGGWLCQAGSWLLSETGGSWCWFINVTAFMPHLRSPQQLCSHPTPFSHTLVSSLLHSAGVGGGPEIQGAGAEALGLLGGQSQTSHLESTHEAECPLPYLVCIHSTHRWLRVSIEWDLEYFFPRCCRLAH